MNSLARFGTLLHAQFANIMPNRSYFAYWIGGLSGNLGWQIQIVAASWLMVTLGASPIFVALVQTSMALPVMLFSLPGGAISDILGSRPVVLWSQAFLMVVAIILAGCAYAGILSPYSILLCTFLVGCGRATYYAGWQAMVVELVEPAEVPRAVALNASNVNIARSLGPAIGGTIVAVWGAFAAFAVTALSNLAIIFVARTWPKTRDASDIPLESLGGAIVAGVRYVALSPLLVVATFRSMIYNIGAVSALALLPLVARDKLDGGPLTYGVLLGAFGAGAVAGALSLDAVMRRMTVERLLAASQLLAGAATIALALSHDTAASAGCALIAGWAWTYVQVVFNSTIQLSSPRWVVGRSLAIYQAAIFGGNALGSLIWGILTEKLDLRIALIAAAGVILAGALIGLRFKMSRLSAGALDQTPHQISPAPQLELDPHDGPIITSIAYRIREQDRARFLNAMRKKRRHRMRDGAMRWTLSRDIHDPQLWFERYHVVSWADAQRLHARRTVEAAQTNALIRSMHLGADAPDVHYTLVSLPRSGAMPPQDPFQGLSV